jgi:hypothetical protein
MSWVTLFFGDTIPLSQIKRNIPIHFKVRRSKTDRLESASGTVQDYTDEEDNNPGGDDSGGGSADAGGTGGSGGGRYEGGTGGRARGGEWQLELAPTASQDPRAGNRGTSTAALAADNSSNNSNINPFMTSGRTPVEEALEEYPALGSDGTGGGGGGSGALGWGRLSGKSIGGGGGRGRDREQYPSLPGSSGSGKMVGGGAGSGASTSTAATIAATIAAAAAQMDSGLWNARMKSDKRLRPMKAGGGGVSLSFKDATEPPLSLAVRLHL